MARLAPRAVAARYRAGPRPPMIPVYNITHYQRWNRTNSEYRRASDRERIWIYSRRKRALHSRRVVTVPYSESCNTENEDRQLEGERWRGRKEPEYMR